MSRIYLIKTRQNSEPYGWSAPVSDDCSPDVTRDADFEIAEFIGALINALIDLDNDEALAIWKEIN
jgi:hypothetical protein